MVAGKLKINLFGESWKLKKICLSDEQIVKWEIISQRMKVSLATALTDPYFYYLLKDNTIQSLDDIEGKEWSGLLNTPKNQIEIWFKNKKVQKLKINDLMEELLLFPLYNVTKSTGIEELEKGMYFEQIEVGLSGSYECFVDALNIDNIQFHLAEINNGKLLERITCQNKGMTIKKSDSLIIYQHSFIL